MVRSVGPALKRSVLGVNQDWQQYEKEEVELWRKTLLNAVKLQTSSRSCIGAGGKKRNSRAAFSELSLCFKKTLTESGKCLCMELKWKIKTCLCCQVKLLSNYSELPEPSKYTTNIFILYLIMELANSSFYTFFPLLIKSKTQTCINFKKANLFT